MLTILGSAALSAFRAQRLAERLRDHLPDLDGLDAQGQQVASPRVEAELAATLLGEFDVSAERCRHELHLLLERLSRLDLLFRSDVARS